MEMFSVLISVYFKESPVFLRQSLDSIFNQTLPPSQVVVVKDGPLTEELDKVIKEYITKYPELEIVTLYNNQGLGKALNEGLKHCSYDLIARMDTDDISKSDRFEKQISVFKKHSEVDVVGAWIEEFEGKISNVLTVRKLPEFHSNIYEFAKFRCPINHPVVMFKKSAVMNAEGYQHFPLFEDYYLWVRMLINGATFYNIQESLLYFRASSAMFERRGGWKYIMNECRFQYTIKKMKFISFPQFMKNVFIRSIIRIIPNSFRAALYKKIIRV